MSRYILGKAKPLRADDDYWWDKGPLLPHLTVDGHEAVDTGLIAATGEPIMRLPNEIGFHRAGQ